MGIKAEEITVNGVTYVQKGSEISEHGELDGLKYAIVRSQMQGVMCGFVESISGRTVVLRRARQMWKWSSRFVLTDVAEYGLTEKWERRFSCEASQKTEMLEACGVLYCTDKAMESLRSEGAVNVSS